MTIIFMFHFIQLSLSSEEFYIFGLLLVVVMSFSIFRTKIELQTKRKLFLLKKEKNEWGIFLF